MEDTSNAAAVAAFNANAAAFTRDAADNIVLERTPFGQPMRRWFPFPPGYRNMNHGSFGTVPIPVHEHRNKLLIASDARPDRFARFDYPAQLLAGRKAAAATLHARFEDVVLIPNATTGVNVVLRNLAWAPGDAILYFSCAYGACAKTILSVCETGPATPARMQLRLTGPKGGMTADEIVQLVEKTCADLRQKGKTPRLLLFDTFVSLPGIRMPFERLTQVCRDQGMYSLVDAAHLMGCADVDVGKLAPDFLVTNGHKWGLVPRSCAAFYVNQKHHDLIRTGFPTGHGWAPPPAPEGAEDADGVVVVYNPFEPGPGEESYFATLFRYSGTVDPTPFFCVTAALEFREKVCGGEKAIIEYCNTLATKGGARVAEILGTEIMDNPDHTFAEDLPMINVRLPLDLSKVKTTSKGISGVGRWMERCCVDDQQNETFIKIDLFDGSFWTRLSAQVYLDLEDFEFVGQTLKTLCRRVEAGEHLEV